MIFVGISDVSHDSNISAWKDGKFFYSKFERESQIKHAKAPSSWFYNKLKSWGIDESNITAFAYVDPPRYYGSHVFPPGPYNGKLYTTSNEVLHGWNAEFLNLPKENYFLLDHHFAHLMSHTTSTSKSKSVITDSGGSNYMTSLLYDEHGYQHFSDGSAGRLLYVVGKKMGILGEESDVVGKVMGLQCYGNPYSDLLSHAEKLDRKTIFNEAIKLIDEIKIDANPHNKEWLDFVSTIFGLGYIIQKKYFSEFDKDTPIIYSGGIALNVNWNRWLRDDGYNLQIEPHVYDGGLSIGCVRFLAERFCVDVQINNFPYIQDDIAPKEIVSDKTIDAVADLLAQGKIVGWYQGHGELGPRALGNRSILMDPSIKNGKDIINQKVKGREWWRPFGASVKQDKALEYFDMEYSPHMLYVSQVLRNDLPSITHEDGTCRHQTVNEQQNLSYYNLLDSFERKTGLPVLLNTSLNLGGNPIAYSPKDAIELFNTTDLDALCIGNELIV